MSLFSDAEQKRVEAAIGALEKTSATELVVAVVPRSGEYWQGRVVLSVAWSLAAAFALAHFVPSLGLVWVLLAQIPVGLATYLLFGLDPLERLLVPASLAEESVSRRAFEVFASRGLHKTRARTGMLILISELEHRVVILGDAGIHERVGDAGWQAHVEHIVAAIRRGDAISGLLEVIERLGRVHADLAPAGGDDTNELPNEVVRG